MASSWYLTLYDYSSDVHRARGAARYARTTHLRVAIPLSQPRCHCTIWRLWYHHSSWWLLRRALCPPCLSSYGHYSSNDWYHSLSRTHLSVWRGTIHYHRYSVCGYCSNQCGYAADHIGTCLLYPARATIRHPLSQDDRPAIYPSRAMYHPRGWTRQGLWIPCAHTRRLWCVFCSAYYSWYWYYISDYWHYSLSRKNIRVSRRNIYDKHHHPNGSVCSSWYFADYLSQSRLRCARSAARYTSVTHYWVAISLPQSGYYNQIWQLQSYDSHRWWMRRALCSPCLPSNWYYQPSVGYHHMLWNKFRVRRKNLFLGPSIHYWSAIEWGYCYPTRYLLPCWYRTYGNSWYPTFKEESTAIYLYLAWLYRYCGARFWRLRLRIYQLCHMVYRACLSACLSWRGYDYK